MAKEATNPKPSIQREWYCLAVHKNTREHTVEYAGAEKLDLQSLQTEALIELLHA